jgi:hypothetical protein
LPRCLVVAALHHDPSKSQEPWADGGPGDHEREDEKMSMAGDIQDVPHDELDEATGNPPSAGEIPRRESPTRRTDGGTTDGENSEYGLRFTGNGHEEGRKLLRGHVSVFSGSDRQAQGWQIVPAAYVA